jgi:2'-5' RNA ligase
MDYVHHELYPLYESMWQEGRSKVQEGQIAYDEFAFKKELDGRRGLSLVARLAPGVVQRLGTFLEVLREIEPQQYYYPLGDVHLTILSLLTAAEHNQEQLAHTDAFVPAVGAALSEVSAFRLETVGITLTDSAVLARGFPEDAALRQIRERIRTTLSAQGLGGGLDRRYHQRAAHHTVVRFTAPLKSAERFAQALQAYRDYPFGSSTIAAVDLAIHDWYLSANRLSILKTYHLS